MPGRRSADVKTSHHTAGALQAANASCRQRWLLRLATALLAALTWLPAQAQESPSHSVRVATFNAYLLSPLFKCLPPGPLILDCLAQITNQTEGWANRLADTILADADRFDILVLNEVWDEDAKDILVRRLKARFPVYVKKLDAPLVSLRAEVVGPLPTLSTGVKLNGEDSGLMLFVRRGFSALPLPSNKHRWGGAKGTRQGSTSHIAFKLFEDYASDDQYAAKGVGFVRLRHNASGVVYNVAFTHLQADYPEKSEFFRNTRKKQFDDVRQVIEETLAPLGSLTELLQRERLILAGDLNISVLGHGNDEWKDLLNTAGSFFSKPLYDTWHAASPEASRGETNEVDADRLDYVLASVEPYKLGMEGRAPMCAQHATVPVDFKQLESDHYMVHVDFNRGFPHCHPRIAYAVSPDELKGDLVIDKQPGNPNADVTRIAFPGSMQWFHVKAGFPGTYTIRRIGQGTSQSVRIDIYAPDDLTTPISRYNVTTQSFALGGGMVASDQFVLPAEYYIRITGPSRSWTGNYALQIKRHTCASKEDACLLQPGMPQMAQLTAFGETNVIGKIQNEAWFRFDVTGQSDTGAAQTVKVTGVGLPQGPNFSAQAVDLVNTQGQPALARTTLSNGLRLSGGAGHGAGGYLLLKQAAPGPQGANLVAHFETSLRLLLFKNLICANETDPQAGSDDVYTRFFIDGVMHRYPGNGYVEFDCDSTRHSQNWAKLVGRDTIVYVDNLRIRLSELDDASADDQSREFKLPTLSELESVREGVLTWKFSGGKYEFPFTVRKRANKPVK
jgi:endonuclease/exonuclease/phosphatase family metal-dependent hydrolase